MATARPCGVSYIGWYYPTLEEVEEQAVFSSLVTHNHPEGVRAAQATAGAVFLARTGATKKEIIRYIHKKFGYLVTTPLFIYRPFGKFDDTAMGTMPLAIRCFLESEDWESCIRNVFSVKCDTDTVACIAGGIADAYYGGTGLDEDALLRRFLIKPNDRGEFDTFLYDWATRPRSRPKRAGGKGEKGEGRKGERRRFMIVISYQSKLVLRVLKGGEIYRAKPNLTLRGEYDALIDLLGLHCECPIFGVLKGKKQNTGGKVSGSVRLVLDVPDKFVHLTEYGVWGGFPLRL